MLDLVNHWNAVLQTLLSGTVLGTVAVVVEFALRLLPTSKPLSLLYMAEDLFHGLGNLAKSAGDALDKVLPQRLSAK